MGAATYGERFTNAVATRLGGLDMAEEFFSQHSATAVLMRGAIRYHQSKGGAAWKAAAVFFRFVITPILKEDREAAARFPIGSSNEHLGDGRN